MIPAFQKKNFLISGLLLFLLISCSPKIRYKVLSFFFDGVPQPAEMIALARRDSLLMADTAKKITRTGRPVKQEYFFHRPYSENKCGNCHATVAGNRLLNKPPVLCYGCHDDLSNKYKTLHGPVASGYCLKCHSHHISKFPKLLQRTGRDLCLYCHDSKQIARSKIHEHSAGNNCTDCHNPHGGENRGILRPGICYKCHENFADKYKTLHGPVASGYCSACHGSHMASQPKLLVRGNQQVCLYCHDQQHVLQNQAHKIIKKSNCTSCHNPHGGNDRFILIQPAVATVKTTAPLPVVPDTLSQVIPVSPPLPQEGKIISPATTGNSIIQAKLYMLSPAGDTLMDAVKNSKGVFCFSKLVYDRHLLFALEHDNAFSGNEIEILFTDSSGKSTHATALRDTGNYFRYTLLPYERSILYILSQNGDTIMAGPCDSKGYFVFNKLPAISDYLFALSGMAPSFVDSVPVLFKSANAEIACVAKKIEKNIYRIEKIPESEISLSLVTPSGDTLMTASNEGENTFVFDRLPQAEYILSLSGALPLLNTPLHIKFITATDSSLETMALKREPDGAFRFEPPVSQPTLYLLNAVGDTLMVTPRDANGNFVFERMPVTADYSFALSGYEKSPVTRASVIFKSSDTTVTTSIVQDTSGKFIPEKVPLTHVRIIPPESEDKRIPRTARLTGYLYKKIPGDIPGGMEIMILDDDGSTLSVTTIDSSGKFSAGDLPARNHYTFRLKADTFPAKIEIPDTNSSLSHILEKDMNGKFHFDKLGWQNAEVALRDISDALLVTPNQENRQKPERLTGHIIGHIEGIINKELEVYALNESREIVGVARIHENGNFVFTRLPAYHNYMFTIKDKNDLPAPGINTLFIGNRSDKEIRAVAKSNDGYFRYKYLPFKDVKIYALDERNDTLISAQLNSDGMFLFELLPEDAGLKFLLEGSGNTAQIEEMSIVVNGRMRLIRKGEDNVFRFVKLPVRTVRLLLMNTAGDTLQTALVNENGFFEFRNGLPEQQEYLFLLDAGNVESIDEIQIAYTDDKGNEKIITPIKEKEGYFSYKKLPATQAKLYRINQGRDTLDVAIMDENGYFTFKKLTPENTLFFLLDLKDAGLAVNLKIHLVDDEGKISEISAAKDTGNLYQYKPLVQAGLPEPGLPVEALVPVHLKKLEEKILSAASTHLEFNFGESVIQIPSYLYIEGVNRLLIKNPSWNIVLSGHTDDIGSDAFNMELSKKRVEAVKKALVKRGIPPARIFTKYYGESMPVANNATPEGRKKNRRVEMVIMKSPVQQPEAGTVQGTGKDWETSIISAGMHDIVFTIQLLVSLEPLAITPLNFNGIENVEELAAEGVNRYIYGISYDYDYASAVLLNEMRKAGFQDAKVIALQNGKRIPVEEAINQTKQ